MIKNKLVILVGILAVSLVVVLTLIFTSEKPEYTGQARPRQILGNPEAKISLVEYGDYQCPACAQVKPFVDQLIADYGTQIKFEYRHFPLKQIHRFAQISSEAAECANDQDKFWDYHSYLYLNQSSLSETFLYTAAKNVSLDEVKFQNCLDSGAKKSIIEADLLQGQRDQIGGTPTFLLDGQKVEDYTQLETLIKAKIEAQNATLPVISN